MEKQPPGLQVAARLFRSGEQFNKSTLPLHAVSLGRRKERNNIHIRLAFPSSFHSLQDLVWLHLAVGLLHCLTDVEPRRRCGSASSTKAPIVIKSYVSVTVTTQVAINHMRKEYHAFYHISTFIVVGAFKQALQTVGNCSARSQRTLATVLDQLFYCWYASSSCLSCLRLC
jgi:hypothetical protein